MNNNQMMISIPILEYKEMVNKIARLNILIQTIKTEIENGNKYPVNDSIVLMITGLNSYKPQKERKDIAEENKA